MGAQANLLPVFKDRRRVLLNARLPLVRLRGLRELLKNGEKILFYWYNNRMQEYVANAIVLKKEPLRDLDGRYSLFTERFGKVIGKTTSSRKITSKLAPHLEPGMVARVRYIEKTGTQIVDALKVGRLTLSLMDLHALAELLPEGQAEFPLWSSLLQNHFSWTHALTILGWDPREAVCARCREQTVSAFYAARQEFFCASCSRKFSAGTLVVL